MADRKPITPDIVDQFFRAIAKNDLPHIKDLLDSYGTPLLKVKNSNLHDGFVDAAWKGHTSIVAFLLERGADMEAHNGSGWTALITAAAAGRRETMHFLLDKGANMEARCESGYSVVMWAASYDEAECVEDLLIRGADATATGRNGITLFRLAIEHGCNQSADVIRTWPERKKELEERKQKLIAADTKAFTTEGITRAVTSTSKLKLQKPPAR